MTTRIKSPAHLERVKQLPCVVCGSEPSDAHHLRDPQITGTSQKASDYLALPLCKEHHQGDSGIHRLGRKVFEAIHGKQIDHVTRTLKRLYP